MEVVLESTEGMPEGGLLSIKVGDTKRQAPVAKLGQPFRFASSPAEPLPLKVELLMLAAPPQVVDIDPAVPQITVNFGGDMKVMLKHREVEDLRRPLVDIGSAAEARGLPAEKLIMAQKAASYLEEHDLVRTFQDILHGLLVTKPSDPHAYVEDRLSRAKKLAAVKTQQDAPQAEATADEGGRGRARRRTRNRRSDIRGTVSSRHKVDCLLMTLNSASDNLQLVLPFLPDNLCTELASRELAEVSQARFAALDTKHAGSLDAQDILPILTEMSSATLSSIGSDQCRRFVHMFDADEDGKISMDEFHHLVQFVIVASFLESSEGQAIIRKASIEEKSFQDFIRMIGEDKDRLWSVMPFLPEWLVQHVMSAEFQNHCKENFASLDADGSGTLEPAELIPVIVTLSEAHPLTIDVDKCRQFTSLFDRSNTGTILQDEFIEFAQFLTVMSFLSNTPEGQQVQQRAELQSTSVRMARHIDMLEKDPSLVSEILHCLPAAFVADLTSDAFKKACSDSFTPVAQDGRESLKPQELFPVITKLSEAYSFSVDQEQFARLTALFDQDKRGVILKADAVNFVTFVVILGYLYFSKENQDMLVADVLLGQEKLTDLLKLLNEGVERVPEVAPYLPQELMDDIMSESFQQGCLANFAALDEDGSGFLEPGELIPVILQLSNAQHYSLTEEHCRHFVDIFDAKHTGAITKDDFVNFARFMMIMAFMESGEGQKVSLQMQVAQGKNAVKELLDMLEQDRNTVHKVIPLLPAKMFNHLSSDEFVLECHDMFTKLDKDKTGVLRPHELFDVVVQMSAAHPYAVTPEACTQFVSIFDIHGDGVLRPDEFLDFARFMCIMSYLHTPEGQDAAQDALQVMEGSKQIEELIAQTKANKGQLHKVIPYVPDWLRTHLLSARFTVECLHFFDDLDKDKNGSLDPEELFPMVLALSNTQSMSLDMAQCRRFMAIFDDEKTGVISKAEFVNFSRFVLIMNYLQDQAAMEGQTEGRAEVQAPPQDPAPMPQQVNEQSGSLGGMPVRHELPASTEHLAVDCDFFKGKSEKLSAENQELRERLLQLDRTIQKMQAKLDDQDQRLRHQEVDLRATAGLR